MSDTGSETGRGAVRVAGLHLLAAAAVVTVVVMLAVGGGVWAVRALVANGRTEPTWPDSVVSVDTELNTGWRGKPPPTVIAWVELNRTDPDALIAIARYAIEVEPPYDPAERFRLIVSGAQTIDVIVELPLDEDTLAEAIG